MVESEEVMEDVKKMAGDVEKVVGSAEALLKERTAIPNLSVTELRDMKRFFNASLIKYVLGKFYK
jgi:hypothetical protein